LRNPHLQTLWPVLFNHRPQPLLRRERVELPDGDFIDLDWCGDGNGPLLIILHGLEGSSRSHYARSLLQAASDRGWRAAVMHFRGCSGSPNRLVRGYHSGETSDLAYMIELLRSRAPGNAIFAVGYSLGGNVLLKWLGESGAAAPLTAACAVSVPFDLATSAGRLETGLSRFYQAWLVKQLKRSVRRKAAQMTLPVDLAPVLRARTFREFDDAYTAPIHGFADADDYYRRSSSLNSLNNIRIPALLLQAADDPFYRADAIPTPAQCSPVVRRLVTDHGGHVGFVCAGDRSSTWRDRTILGFLNDSFAG
jgi:predicted alpha/beta-fold hydrolase